MAVPELRWSTRPALDFTPGDDVVTVDPVVTGGPEGPEGPAGPPGALPAGGEPGQYTTRTGSGTGSAWAAKPVAKGELVFDARDYGSGLSTAAGAGAANASAVNAAITAAASTSTIRPRSVLIPGGAYDMGAIVFASGVKLRCEGATLKRTGSASSVFLNATGVEGVEILDAILDANGLASVATVRASTGTTGMAVRRCTFLDATQASGVHAFDTQGSTSDLTVEDCKFLTRAGIRINLGPQNVTIRNNTFKNWRERCIYVIGTSTASVQDLWIEKNRVTDMAAGGTVRQAITVQGDDASPHRRLHFNFNTVIGPGTAYNDPTTPGTADQLSLHRVVGFDATGNISIGSGDVGFTVAQQCRGGSIVGGYIEGANSAGMALGSGTSTYTRGLAVVGVVLMNNGQDLVGDRTTTRQAIWMRNLSNSAVSGCVMGDDQGTKTQQHGVSLGSCSNVQFGVNTDAGNAVGMFDTSPGSNTNCQKPTITAV